MSNIVKIQQLQSVVDDETFNLIKKEFAGCNIYIPKNHNEEHPDRKVRNEGIREDYYKGLDVPNLSVKYNLSKSHIYKILEKG
ncbi:MAG: hypothetical protein JJT76_06940 [Clostridiaceae bacterium]|nr:hypothetical protein [Clostridiaceae bacterium]